MHGLTMEQGKIEDIAKQLGDRKLMGVPDIILRLVVIVATNTKLSQATINIFAHFALNSTATGYIATKTAPEEIAAALGINRATVFGPMPPWRKQDTSAGTAPTGSSAFRALAGVSGSSCRALRKTPEPR
jgi:ADP-heptose:LPS heptosyltransferase